MFGIAGAFIAQPPPDCEAFCRTHWPRLHALACRRGCSPHEAEDAVQELFEKLVARGGLAPLARLPHDTQRTHLTVRLHCHLANRWRNARRLRRGGGVEFVPLIHRDGTMHDAPAPRQDHETLHALQALGRAFQQLRSELKPDAWRRVSPWLEDGDETGPRKTNATRVALHRARRRLRELLQHEA